MNLESVDLRIPSELYEKIESIAIATNQPFTPKSKNTDNPKRGEAEIRAKSDINVNKP